MKVDIFDFDLDKDLIAKEPVNPRDSSKLLDLSEENTINDKHFFDLGNFVYYFISKTFGVRKFNAVAKEA